MKGKEEKVKIPAITRDFHNLQNYELVNDKLKTRKCGLF